MPFFFAQSCLKRAVKPYLPDQDALLPNLQPGQLGTGGLDIASRHRSHEMHA